MSLAAPYPGTYLYKRGASRTAGSTTNNADLVDDNGIQIAPLHYPHLRHTEIFHSVEDFYQALLLPRAEDRLDRQRDGAPPQMMKRRLREGVEFFHFLRERKEAAREALNGASFTSPRVRGEVGVRAAGAKSG